MSAESWRRLLEEDLDGAEEAALRRWREELRSLAARLEPRSRLRVIFDRTIAAADDDLRAGVEEFDRGMRRLQLLEGTTEHSGGRQRRRRRLGLRDH